MATTTISVNKQTIEEFLLNARTKTFLIPEYQRPYSWTSEQIDTLFNDIWDFTCNEGGSDREGTYFLGSIVSYENDKREQEIIDSCTQNINEDEKIYIEKFLRNLMDISKEVQSK